MTDPQTEFYVYSEESSLIPTVDRVAEESDTEAEVVRLAGWYPDTIYFVVTALRGWYVEIVREPPFENVLIGPFGTEEAATAHAQDSADVEDWCYGEAKAKGYTVDDVKIVRNPTLIPSYGANAPVYPIYQPGHPLGILPGTEENA